MPKMTKQEFATRLLFWLMPWPISRALPKSLRVFYWGPSATPPPGYDPTPPPGSLPPGDPYFPGPWGTNPPGQPGKDVWYDLTDDNYWEPIANFAPWDGEKWNEIGPGGRLGVKSGTTWTVGFRPTKIRIFYEHSGAQYTTSLAIYTSAEQAGYDANYESGEELDLVCTSDIDYFNFYVTYDVTYITKIQFYI